MKKTLVLFAAGALVALFRPAGMAEDQYTDLPDHHLGARHLLFTGTETILGTTDPGNPTADGRGFRNATGTAEMTLSVPDLEITDLVISFATIDNADRAEDGNGTVWGEQAYSIDGHAEGRLYMVGTINQASETQIETTRQYGGSFFGGPLGGAHVVATEEIEETTDSAGTVISRTSTIRGVLIISWYEDFTPFDEMSSLPPLTPFSELPPGFGWRTYVTSASDTARGSFYHLEQITIEELENLELGIPNRITTEKGGALPSSLFMKQELHLMEGSGDFCGKIMAMGVYGYGPEPELQRVSFHDHAGAFWGGPLAGCLYLVSQRFPESTNSGVLIVPDTISLDLTEPQTMLNISERGYVGTGEEILIAGFVVSGKRPKMVLVRGVGPGLEPYGVEGFLANPVLEVYRQAEPDPILVATNATWWRSEDAGAIRTESTNAGAFPLLERSNDAAILFSWLEPGAYTAQVSGVGGTTGVALAEVYQLGY